MTDHMIQKLSLQTVFMMDKDFPKLSTDLVEEGLQGYNQFISDNLEEVKFENYLFKVLGPTIQNQQYFTINQVGEILSWRRPTQPGHLQRNENERVKLISKQAFAQEDEEIRTHILTLIRGIAIPTATKILSVTFPDMYPTLNKMNWMVLRKWKYLDGNYSISSMSWMDYLQSCRLLMKRFDISGRELDQALIATYLKYSLKLNLQTFVPLDRFF